MDHTLSTLGVIHRFMATQNDNHNSDSNSNNVPKRRSSYEQDFDFDQKILPITSRKRCISVQSDLLPNIPDALQTGYRRKSIHSFDEKRQPNFSDNNFLVSQFDGIPSFNERIGMDLCNYESRRMSTNSARATHRNYDAESTLSPDFQSKEVDDIDFDEIEYKCDSVDQHVAGSSIDRTIRVEPLIKVFPPTPRKQVYTR